MEGNNHTSQDVTLKPIRWLTSKHPMASETTKNQKEATVSCTDSERTGARSARGEIKKKEDNLQREREET